MGCRIATVAAAQKPERVAGLFLVDMEMEPRPSPHIDLSALEKMRRLPFHFSSEEELDRELLSYGYSEAAISQLKAKNKIYRDPETSSFQVLAHPLTRYLAETKISTSPEAKEAFRKLPYRAFPLKLLIAERESSVTDEGLAWMKATQPDLSCERIEGSDHRIHKTALTTFLATLTTFADSLS
jgi:pimeloyl-ACP methyl ester carboxylesterase